LGLGNEVPTCDPQIVIGLSKAISKIDCGLKHCVALSKDYQLFVWGSNLQAQLGKKTAPHKPFLNTPTLNQAYQDAKPFKIACGSYHNVCLSYRMPRQEETQNEAHLGDENRVNHLPLG
jgi:alpha-tubulin suppressor-like RCC1 family protein